MSKLVKPHGKDKKLKPLLLEGKELSEEKKKAEGLRKVPITSRETGDAIMMGIGAFTPLGGFMCDEDWKGVCRDMKLKDGTFWPIPVTVSATKEDANAIKDNEEVVLIDEESLDPIATMTVTKKYAIDKELECREVFRTTDTEHPGVAKVMSQKDVNLAGPIKVISESYFPEEFAGIYQRPAEARKMFEEKGWSTVAALQLRNPMHRSHEYLAKIALEILDGLYIHQLLGKLKAGDIPADVRVKCIDVLVDNYFLKDSVIQGGYPLEMRYGGPREALLHAVFRQNYGCSHLIVGRDHAGVGDYYGPFDAQKIFEEIPKDALECQPLKIDWTFYCFKCRGMASMKTCPHGKEDRLLLSGTMLRKTLSEGGEVPADFSRPEVLTILQDYYQGLEKKVDIKLHGFATGEGEKK
ncbi:MAG: sulfate adenylyltransferase [Candidatus Latescibacteria bacterium]|nr:sulfate adenylyltransferase [Candidatus Latescibacterota bacterium]NIO55244.1 sulfate adenylyltransferase [Candidatus Latescibacterota bacterium]